MQSIELFAGAGGLAIGMANAGFHHAAVIEWNHEACETFRENQKHHAPVVEGWPLYEMDARLFNYKSISGEIFVISGGPPCQPFSNGGKHLGQSDSRDMFPEAVRAVRSLRPKAFIFENVKGLTRESFNPYFSYVLLQLQYPEIEQRRSEDWRTHRSRLEKHHTSNRDSATYNVVFDVVNAADFGVPQKRERVFIVGFRSDLGLSWSFPKITHSEESLLVEKWISGEYWERHSISRRRRTKPTDAELRNVERLADIEGARQLKPWRTIRDVISDLPDPQLYPDNEFSNHIFIPGARVYKGHTGSRLDDSSKTLKAGSHGVPGGENMFVQSNGVLRYFTVREAARIQTFPDEYEFFCSWSDTMRQLGNAVPVKLAEVMAKSIAKSLRKSRSSF